MKTCEGRIVLAAAVRVAITERNGVIAPQPEQTTKQKQITSLTTERKQKSPDNAQRT